MLKVSVFSINTTAGKRYGLVNTKENQVLYNATPKWKTPRGPLNYAKKHGYDVVEDSSCVF